MLRSFVSRYLNAPPPSKPEQEFILQVTEYLKSREDDSGVIASSYTDDRNCPLCGEAKHPERVIKGFRWRTCDRCAIDYVGNILTEDFHTRPEFDHAVSHMGEAERQSEANAPSASDNDSIAYILKHFPNIGALVDIGCGAGNFLEAAKALDIPLLGIDVNSAARDATSRRGIPAICPEELAANVTSPADGPIIFTMRQVIEHLRDLRDMFNWLHESVPGPWGLLVETPNNKSWSVGALDYNHRHYDGWMHLQIMSPQTVEVLAKECKLDLVDNSTYGENFGLRSWLQTRYAPWYYDPMSDGAVSRWRDTQSRSIETDVVPVSDQIVTASWNGCFRRVAVKSIRHIDGLIQHLKPESNEYIRAAFWKS